MLMGISGQAKVFVCKEAVDMRKSFEGLSAIVESIFDTTLTSGAYFVFLNRLHDRMKVLYWDSDGLAIWYKRLEKGRFSRRNNENIMMDRREFFMLLEGITPHRLQRRYKLC
jgi:transposase